MPKYGYDDDFCHAKPKPCHGCCTGPQGPVGTILGSYETLCDFVAAHPIGKQGESYLVSGILYVWNDTLKKWEKMGSLKGPTGTNGKSAYQSALDNGFVGTEQEWLNSLKGAQGARGAMGAAGQNGLAATVAVENSVRVPFDDNPFVENIGTAQNAILRFGIPAGMPGEQGVAGADGKSAYQLAVDSGFTGSETEWLESLKGATGAIGPTGPAGPAAAKVYAYIFNYADQTVEPDCDVVFDQPPVPSPLPRGIAFSQPSSEIQITAAGVYDVSYYALGPYTAPLTLVLNGEEIEGTLYQYGLDCALIYGQALLVIESDKLPATLSLRNPIRQGALYIRSTIYEMHNVVSASIRITKID